jgi:hypothetical protein
MPRRRPHYIILLLASHQYLVGGQATWPAATDDLEDILFLNSGYRARSFAEAVTPCSAGAGPGRVAAAEYGKLHLSQLRA